MHKDQSPKTDAKQKNAIEKDAQGQFAGTQHGGESDGVVSAKPTVINGSEDATVHKWPPNKKNPPDDWDANFDLRDQKET